MINNTYVMCWEITLWKYSNSISQWFRSQSCYRLWFHSNGLGSETTSPGHADAVGWKWQGNYQRHEDVHMHLENFAGIMMKWLLVLHWCMNVFLLCLGTCKQIWLLTYSPNVRDTGVMRWTNLLSYQTEASLWQRQKRRFMLTTKSGIWLSDVWVCMQVVACVIINLIAITSL